VEKTHLFGKAYAKRIGRRNLLLYHLLYLLFWIFIYKYGKKKIQEEMETQIAFLRKNLPGFFKVLTNVSIGAHIKLKKLVTVQITLGKYMDKACTVTAMTAPATKGDQTFMTQNFDLGMFDLLKPLFRFFFTRKPRVHRFNQQGNPPYDYMYLGIPLLFEVPLLNEKGLGFAGTATILEKGSKNIDASDKGLPIYVLDLTTIMHCATVSHVKELWMKTTRSSSPKKIWPYHWDFETSAWCDAGGGILMIEQTHNHIAMRDGGTNGVLWHTNHHVWLDTEKTGSIKDEGQPHSSFRRYERAAELLSSSTNNGNLSEETCQSLIRDHEGGYWKRIPDEGDICRHPNITAFAWVINPQSLTVHWTRGQPCRCKSSFRVRRYSFNSQD